MGGAGGLANPIQWKRKVEALPVSTASMKCLAVDIDKSAKLYSCDAPCKNNENFLSDHLLNFRFVMFNVVWVWYVCFGIGQLALKILPCDNGEQ